MIAERLLIEEFKNNFPKSYYQRGLDYYKRGKVKSFSSTETGVQRQVIKAVVTGSHEKDYSLEVVITRNLGVLRIAGHCSCPVGFNCKHVIAAVLAVRNYRDTQSDKENKHAAISNIPKELENTPVGSWLADLQDTLNQQEPVESLAEQNYKLLYLLSGDNRDLKVSLQLASLSSHGVAGRLIDLDFDSPEHGELLTPLDGNLIARLLMDGKARSGRLEQLKAQTSSFPLSNSNDERLLREIIQTRRCYWLAPSRNSLPLTLAEPIDAELAWKQVDNGFQQLICDCENETLQVFALNNLWYIDKRENQIGLVKTELDKKIARVLLRSPSVAPSQIQQINKILKQHNIELAAPAKLLNEKVVTNIKPTPCLSIFMANLTIEGERYHYTPEVLSSRLAVGELSFDYQGKKVLFSDPDSQTIDFVEGDTLVRIKRNAKQEQKALETLEDLDAEMLYGLYSFAALSKREEHYFLLEHEFLDPLDFSANAVPELIEKGWRVDIAENYQYQLIEAAADDWYSSIEPESSGIDWFNLELGIKVNDQQVNLLPVMQDVLQQIKKDEELESAYVRLESGKYLSLPVERVRAIANVLIELYDSNTFNEKETLRMSSMQAMRLLELEAAMGSAKLRWHGATKLKRLADKLANFKSVMPVQPPESFKGELRPYQLDGLSWMQFLREYELSGILADDMGLGKTVQALAHLCVEKDAGRMTKPTLIVAPTSLMFNWRQEAEKFAPHLKTLTLHGPKRKQHFAEINNYDLIFTTYPLIARDKDVLLAHEFYFLILDEAQSIKNAKSLAAKIAIQLKAEHRLCLTGTPMENHLGELWSLFNFMMPGLLGDSKSFTRLFKTPIEKKGDTERQQNLARRVAPFLLRRTKDAVVKELPEKVHVVRHAELEGAQRDLYETIRVSMQKKVRDEIAKLGLARSHIVILDALLKLRQICCDPRLLKIDSVQKQQAKSAKLDLLMQMLPEMLEEGRRVLLFSQFTELLKLIEEELVKKNIPYVKLTGQTRDRETPIKQFQEGKVPLFLISLKAGGTGLNLTAADTVIHYDPWWNPAVEDQASDRAHRIGQKKTVFVYKLLVKGSIEEKILEMQENKRALMDGLFSTTKRDKFKLTEDDLRGLFDPLESLE
jgi:SNF2 family DNA or RNA helicase